MSLEAILMGAAERARPPKNLPILEAQLENMRLLVDQMIHPRDPMLGELVTLHHAFEYRAEPWAGMPMTVIEVAPLGCSLIQDRQRDVMGQLSFRLDVAVMCQEPNGMMGIRVFDRRTLVRWSERKKPDDAAEE